MNKIFSIGLSRTGTRSVSDALDILGYNIEHTPHIWSDLMVGEFQIPEEWDGISDMPAATYFQEWDQEYPGSKFILTTRPVEGWVESMRWLLLGRDELKQVDPTSLFPRGANYRTLCFSERILRNKWWEHHTLVFKYFENRLGDLLTLDITRPKKWEKLCGFLEKDIPDVSFPHENKRRRRTQQEKIAQRNRG